MFIKAIATGSLPEKPALTIKGYSPTQHNISMLAALEKEPAERIFQRYLEQLDPTSILKKLNQQSLQTFVLWDAEQEIVAGWGELHGLYELAEGRASSVISLWMRTARHRRVVAFRAFLRTFLHEYCHHLDYHLFNLPDSFHTEGFYKRESSLFHQLLPEAETSKK